MPQMSVKAVPPSRAMLFLQAMGRPRCWVVSTRPPAMPQGLSTQRVTQFLILRRRPHVP
jgi:hypothetical protein